MPTRQELMPVMHTVLRDAARNAGDTSGFIRRPTLTQLRAETFVTSRVFACLGERQPTLDDVAATRARVGTPVPTHAFDDRFRVRAVACLRQGLAAALAHRVVAAPRAVPLLAH